MLLAVVLLALDLAEVDLKFDLPRNEVLELTLVSLFLLKFPRLAEL